MTPVPLASLLPPNATRLEKALQIASKRLDDIEVHLRRLWSPDECPEGHLPWLAWSLSLDGWSTDWPISIKRNRVRRAIQIARRKGTVESVRGVVESFGGGVAIREWWQQEPRGEPFTFDLVLTLSGAGGMPITAQFIDAVIGEVHRAKPARSHFTFTQGLAASSMIGVCTRGRPAIYARLSSRG
jgi:phage tail P2-like protein